METTLENGKIKTNCNVLILPMRNGNLNKIGILNEPVYSVLILPMRNGNLLPIMQPFLAILVLILPMRNGNS